MPASHLIQVHTSLCPISHWTWIPKYRTLTIYFYLCLYTPPKLPTVPGWPLTPSRIISGLTSWTKLFKMPLVSAWCCSHVCSLSTTCHITHQAFLWSCLCSKVTPSTGLLSAPSRPLIAFFSPSPSYDFLKSAYVLVNWLTLLPECKFHEGRDSTVHFFHFLRQ